MKKAEFMKAMKKLTIFYNKDFNSEQLSQWYSFLKNESLENFDKAIELAIRNSSYIPTISELLKNIKFIQKQEYLDAVELMKENNYFHNEKELQNTLHFIDVGVIPYWLKLDMEYYLNKNKKILITTNGILEIENKN